MRVLSSLLAAIALAPLSAMALREVFAHYMVGITSGQTYDDWARDIRLAKDAKIDGFALNVGPNDGYNDVQLGLAYQVARDLGGFKLFYSFDQVCCGNWPPQRVADFINRFKDHPAQFKVDGKPFVSTFEGVNWIGEWNTVKQMTGPLYLVPAWTSMGPDAYRNQNGGGSDGIFPWDAWPHTPSPSRKDTGSDIAWRNAANGKAFMMPVSPWFYTNLPQYGKNWNWDSDTLWFDRWEQVLDLMPQYVEIITWNDYGEAHYINPIRQASVVSGADVYVNNMSHEGWRWILPYYITAYKAGTRNVPITNNGAVFWYRTTPKNVCGNGGTICDNSGRYGGGENCVRDSVFAIVASNVDTTANISIGGSGQTFNIRGGAPRLIEMPFNGRTGNVVVSVASGRTGTGPRPIVNQCPGSGRVNFNAVTGTT